LRLLPSSRLRPAFLVALLFACGCDNATSEGECPIAGAGDCYEYQAFGNGTLGAQGFLTLQVGEPSGEAQTLQGVWRIERTDAEVFVGEQIGTGVLSGTLRDTEFLASLNPELSSGGVELVGTLAGGVGEGVWIDAAQGASGEFELRLVEE
jgi:hypothetical protein